MAGWAAVGKEYSDMMDGYKKELWEKKKAIKPWSCGVQPLYRDAFRLCRIFMHRTRGI